MKKMIFTMVLFLTALSFGVTGTNIDTTGWEGAQIRGCLLSDQWTLIDDFLTTCLTDLSVDTSSITLEGTTADAFETIITATDPTADIIWTLPDGGADTLAFMGSTLATNYPDVASSVTGGTSQLIFEGTTSDAFESILQATDPTADLIWILPDGATDSFAVMGSTLTTNIAEAANSIWGGTNQLIFEGATADAFETFYTVVDPTSDNTITFPNASGTVMLINEADVVVTDAAAYDVLAANSGKLHMITDLTQNTSIDLPAEADGLNYVFWYVGGAAEAHDHVIDSENDTNFFIGGVAFADIDAGDAADEIHAGVYSDGDSNSKLTVNNMSAGTKIEVTCDGTNWYVTGVVYSDTVPAFGDQ